jgi:hypothetical protein
LKILSSCPKLKKQKMRSFSRGVTPDMVNAN